MPAITIGGLEVESLNLVYQWGLAPASGSITAVGSGGVAVEDEVSFTVGGFNFAGIAKSVVQNIDDGRKWSIGLVDFREKLKDDTVYGFFNRPDIIEDDPATPGIDRKKRYVHLYPDDWDAYRLTWTDAPLSAKEILQKLFTAPTVRHTWSLTDHARLGLKIREINAETGKELGAVLQEVLDECRLIMTITGESNLRFAVQGEGAIPPFPLNSHSRSIGQAQSEAPTKVRIVGDRNQYQVMNIPLEPDWNRSWEQWWGEMAWLDRVNSMFGPYGKTKAELVRRARDARVKTVRDVVLILGAQYADYGLWGDVSRMEIPAWIYLQDIVWKSYRIPRSLSVKDTPLRSAELREGLIVPIQYSAQNGRHVRDSTTRDVYPETKAFVTVQGQPLDVWDPSRAGDFEPNLLASARNAWQANNRFNLDTRNYAVVFQEATFRDGLGDKALLVFPNENISGIDDDLRYLAVPNAAAEIQPANVFGTFTFAAEYFAAGFGTGRRADTVHQAGLHRDSYGQSGTYVELPYADGETADVKAKEIADLILTGRNTILSGGYTRAGEAGTTLTGAISQVSLSVTFGEGVQETVQFSNDQQGFVWDSDRELERRRRSKELFPGQERLRDEARQLEQIALHLKAANRQSQRHYENLADVQMKPTTNGDPNAKVVRLSQVPGQPIPAGTPIWRDSAEGIGLVGTQFVGVSILSRVTGSDLAVARQGLVPTRVRGPFVMGDRVGCKTAQSAVSADTFATVSGTKGVGTVMATYEGSDVILAPVLLHAGRNSRLGFETFAADGLNVSIWPSFVFGLDAGAVIPKMNDSLLTSEPAPKIALPVDGWVAIFIEVEPTARLVSTGSGDSYEIVDGGGVLAGDIVIKVYADSSQMNDDVRPAAINYSTGLVANTGRFAIPLARRNSSGLVEHLGHYGPIGVRLCSNGILSVAGATRAVFESTETVLP